MARSPRGHFLRAAEMRTVIQAPSIAKYRKEPSATVRCDFSNERLQYCVDIAVLVGRCDRSGFMAAYLSGMRWELVPPAKQGQVASDIRKFRRELREGGYSVE
jgi:hypothetical protein